MHTLLPCIAYIMKYITTSFGLFKNENGINDVGDDGLARAEKSLGGILSELLSEPW